MGLRIERFMFESFRGIQSAEELKDHDTPEMVEVSLAEEEDASAAAPAITQEELDAAKGAGYKEGYDAGHTAGTQEVESQQKALDQQIVDMLPKVIEMAVDAQAKYVESLQTQQENASLLALAIAKKVAGSALKQDPLAEIEILVKESLSSLSEAPSVTLYVNPEIAETLKQRIDNMVKENPSLSANISVLEDPSIVTGDCRIEWNGGAAERNMENIWESISRIVNQKYDAVGGSTQYQEPTTDAEQLEKVEETTTEPVTTDVKEAAEEDIPAPVVEQEAIAGEEEVTEAAPEQVISEEVSAEPAENTDQYALEITEEHSTMKTEEF